MDWSWLEREEVTLLSANRRCDVFLVASHYLVGSSVEHVDIRLTRALIWKGSLCPNETRMGGKRASRWAGTSCWVNRDAPKSRQQLMTIGEGGQVSANSAWVRIVASIAPNGRIHVSLFLFTSVPVSKVFFDRFSERTSLPLSFVSLVPKSAA